MDVCMVKILNFRKINISKVKKYISEERMLRVDKFLKYEDKIRSIYGELIIRMMIMDKYKMGNKDISFEVNDYGKPGIKGRKDMYFNVSHSEKYVVCCLDDNPVGIDVENIVPIDFKSFAEGFLSIEEENYILGENTLDKKIIRFYEIWTLRESFVKCVGKGLSIPLNEFYIQCNRKENVNLVSEKFNSKYFFKKMFIDINYIMSLCSKNCVNINKFNFILEDNLLKHFNIQ